MNSPDNPNTALAISGQEQRPFFYRLNQLRIVCALPVFACHIELYKQTVGLPSAMAESLVRCGHQGVNFFFVLSGFLITYFILDEQMKTSTVNIQKFYRRRIRRVWPLYYLVVVVAFVAVPFLYSYAPSTAPRLLNWHHSLSTNFGPLLFLFVFMMPNVALVSFLPVECAVQCWTVGVEEQFYIMWPFLHRLSRRCPWLMMSGCVLLKMGALLILSALLSWSLPATKQVLHPGALRVCSALIREFDMEALALGGIAAYLLLCQPDSWFVRLMTKPTTTIGAVTPLLVALMPLLVSLQIAGEHSWVEFGPRDFFVALSFACIIMSLAKAESKPVSVLGKTLNYCGTITYGFYMYNLIAIAIVVNLIFHFSREIHGLTFNLLLYAGSLALTFVFSILSYEFYESRFYKVRNRTAAGKYWHTAAGYLNWLSASLKSPAE